MQTPSPGGKIDLSVVVPRLNPGPDIKTLASRVRQALEEHQITWEILFVDTAPSGAVDIPDYVRVIEAASGRFGDVSLAGIRAAQGEYVLTLDDDFAEPEVAIASLWEARGHFDIVVGSRFVDGSQPAQSGYELRLSRALNRFYARALSTPVVDVTSGIRLYRRRLFQHAEFQNTGFPFLLESLLIFIMAGYRVTEIPLVFCAPRYRYRRPRGFELGRDLLRAFFRIWRLRNSVESADYDYRAFDSRMPLQRYWQRKRSGILVRFAQGSSKITDVGCGTGRTVTRLPEAVGNDLRHDKLRFLRQTNRFLVNADGLALPYRDGTFDCIINSEVIEHIPEEDGRLIDELSRVLADDGILVIGTPDYSTVMWNVLEWIYGKVAPGAYAHEHVTHYTYKTLRQALVDRDYEILDYDYVFWSIIIFKARKRPPQ